MRAAPALDRTLSALADPTRRAIVELLRKQPHRAGELAASLAVSAPALSRHLRILRQGRLVADEHVEHDARVRVYRLRRDGLSALNDWVDEMSAFRGDPLQSLRAHTERDSRARVR